MKKTVPLLAAAATIASLALAQAQSGRQPPNFLQPPPNVMGAPPLPQGLGLPPMPPGLQQSRKKGVMRFDFNGDGAVTFDEFSAGAQKRFEMLDADGNGIVTTAEIDAHLMKQLVRKRQRLLKMRDFDGDGSISRKEFEFGVQQRFTRLDRDGNGRLEAVGNHGGRPGHGTFRGRHDWRGGGEENLLFSDD